MLYYVYSRDTPSSMLRLPCAILGALNMKKFDTTTTTVFANDDRRSRNRYRTNFMKKMIERVYIYI